MIELTPAEGAAQASIPASQEIQRLHREALPRVQAAALAWRNGLAGLLAGLLGFSLIKGRSDVAQLAAPYGYAVGVLLVTAVIVGGFGAVQLLWAAHGRPRVMDRLRVASAMAADHAEARRGVLFLRNGIRLSLACAALLVTAVVVTWYGPAKDAPKLRVSVGEQVLCGSVTRVAAGALTLKTDLGERHVDLARATGLQAVDGCAPRA
ncbi:hypothetical protein [Nonomuraea sp. NPDC049480]|uniref:hypothetical protein n=1 Tax=Nonomuraea sp. NPDC049480 TaxID=3364353 RepID=UPI0037AA98E8